MWVSYFTVEYFQSNFQLSFSERGTNRRTAEEAAYMYLMDFLDSCEGIYIYIYIAMCFSVELSLKIVM